MKWNERAEILTVKFGDNIINYTLFRVRVFNRRVIICYEVALKKKQFSLVSFITNRCDSTVVRGFFY